jgi:hypothetical protein
MTLLCAQVTDAYPVFWEHYSFRPFSCPAPLFLSKAGNLQLRLASHLVLHHIDDLGIHLDARINLALSRLPLDSIGRVDQCCKNAHWYLLGYEAQSETLQVFGLSEKKLVHNLRMGSRGIISIAVLRD